MSNVRILKQHLLSDNWYVLKKIDFELQRRDGSWQPQTREVYDRGNGATIGLYNRARRTVILTRQFRIPAFVNEHHGYLIEAAAGLLDNVSPEERIRLEAEEETGYRVRSVRKIFEAFMSPGSVTERVHFFVGEYQPEDRINDGGGLVEEGEEIEVLELARQVQRHAGCGEIVFQPLPVDDPRRRRPDIARAREILGWEPTVDRAEGLRRTLDYFRAAVESTAAAPASA